MMLIVAALATAVVAAVRGMWSPCGLSMLSSLNPVSESARRHRFWVTAAWYVTGAATGGAVLGAGCAVGAFGYGRLDVDASWTWGIALAGAALAVASDSALVGLALPVHPRQVDERWLARYRQWIYAGGYGVQIGTGFATYIMTAAVYLTTLLAVLTGRPAAAFGIGLTFGAVRGLGVLVTATVRTPEQLRDRIARVDRLAQPSLRVACAVDALVGVLVALALGGTVLAAIVAVPLVVLAAGRHGRRARRRVSAPA
jgi:voltage-gated potassium channel Kch